MFVNGTKIIFNYVNYMIIPNTFVRTMRGNRQSAHPPYVVCVYRQWPTARGRITTTISLCYAPASAQSLVCQCQCVLYDLLHSFSLYPSVTSCYLCGGHAVHTLWFIICACDKKMSKDGAGCAVWCWCRAGDTVKCSKWKGRGLGSGGWLCFSSWQHYCGGGCIISV